MGISYNPSSFDTNKTILQAIEELKKYLMNNPLSCIYQTTSSVSVNTSSLNDVIVPTGQEIKIGDLVVSANGYYNFVDSVGTNDVYFSSDWVSLGLDVNSITLNVDSTATEIVGTPANFTAWIYRRIPRPNDTYLRGRQYYLEITYKDSTAFPSTQTADIYIPANYLNAIWYQLNVDNSTTIYFDFTEDASQGVYQETSFTIPAGQNGSDGVSITGATIDASNHLILTLSDGNTIDAGVLPTPSEYTHVVTISTTSGTFSDSDFALLGYGDSVIIYDDGSIKTAYKLKIETASVYEFECIDATSKNNLKLIDVNKTTKAYSMTSIAMIKSATFDSGTATSGKVLTANGSGGTSWETPGGGTFEHYVITTSTSGTLTNDDYNKLLYNDSVFIYDGGYSTYQYYNKAYENDTLIRFERIVRATSNTQKDIFEITKATKAYSKSLSNCIITSVNVSSGSETSGKVLTADGVGGASWQTPSGGSLYAHHIKLSQIYSLRYYTFTIINDVSTAYSSVADVCAYLNSKNISNLCASGIIIVSTGSTPAYYNCIVLNIGKNDNTHFTSYFKDINDQTHATISTAPENSTDYTIVDSVVQIM